MKPNLTLGIDATNLRQGGGRTHLIELLRAANPADHGFVKVVVWGAQSTLALLEDREWLIKRNPPAQEGGLIKRTLWQRFELSRQARTEGCDILFVPGGSFSGNFRPIVTMSQNLLPFEGGELKRYGFSLTAFKLLLLRWTQARSFMAADGVIFLTRYAQEAVQRVTGELRGLTEIVPHGLNRRFIRQPRLQKPIADYSSVNPYRVLYVSIINQYKHQWHVVEAMGALRQVTGWPLVLELVGPAYPPALVRLNRAIETWDPHAEWVKYHGAVPYNELHQMYEQADLGLFASSCENMPNILLETMASGLPVTSSHRGPMPEILGDAGIFFDPETPNDIARALEGLIADPRLRSRFAAASFSTAQQYTWQRCADETFGFLSKVHQQSSHQR